MRAIIPPQTGGFEVQFDRYQRTLRMKVAAFGFGIAAWIALTVIVVRGGVFP